MKGIIVDVSHLSDTGFWNVADIMQQKGVPFVASHSNSREMTNHPRNMTDEMIKRLAECGGVMGLNLSPHFLNNNEPKDGHSRIEDMVKHVLHIRKIGGSEVLSIGSDFDGIEGTLEVASPKDFDKLWEALSKAGLSQSELDKMWQYNARRVLEAVLK